LLRESCESHEKEQDRDVKTAVLTISTTASTVWVKSATLRISLSQRTSRARSLVYASSKPWIMSLRRLVATRSVLIHSGSHTSILINVIQTILDCSEANEGFYVKCGFKRAGLEMAHYYNKS